MGIVDDIVGVQPMSGPTTTEFSFKYVITDGKFPFGKEGDRIHSLIEGWGVVKKDENDTFFVQYDSGHRSDWYERLSDEERKEYHERRDVELKRMQEAIKRPILIPMIKNII